MQRYNPSNKKSPYLRVETVENFDFLAAELVPVFATYADGSRAIFDANYALTALSKNLAEFAEFGYPATKAAHYTLGLGDLSFVAELIEELAEDVSIAAQERQTLEFAIAQLEVRFIDASRFVMRDVIAATVRGGNEHGAAKSADLVTELFHKTETLLKQLAEVLDLFGTLDPYSCKNSNFYALIHYQKVRCGLLAHVSLPNE